MAKQRSPVSSAKDLVVRWRQFCTAIVEEGYVIAPTITEFIRFVVRQTGATEEAVAAAVERHLPRVRQEVESIRGDVLSQGTMLGKYQSTMSVLAVKNWCGWADKQEAAKGRDPVGLAEAAAQIERLLSDVE